MRTLFCDTVKSCNSFFLLKRGVIRKFFSPALLVDRPQRQKVV